MCDASSPDLGLSGHVRVANSNRRVVGDVEERHESHVTVLLQETPDCSSMREGSMALVLAGS